MAQYSSAEVALQQLLDLVNKVKKKAYSHTDVLPEPGTGHGPRGPAMIGHMAARMYGSGVESNVAAKGDRLDLPSDPNQTAHPRIGMSGALAEPAKKAAPKARMNVGVTKKPAVKEKKKTKPLTQAEKMSDFITTISR